MAGKKRKKQRSRQRQSFAPTATRVDSGADDSQAVSPAAPALAGAATAAPRTSTVPSQASAINRPRRPAATAVTGTIDIDARVPYFASDLRRVLITAAVMIVLIVVGSLLIH